jgi:hypothetical protein
MVIGVCLLFSGIRHHDATNWPNKDVGTPQGFNLGNRFGNSLKRIA